MKKTRTQGLHMLKEIKQLDLNLSKGWGQFVTPLRSVQKEEINNLTTKRSN